MADSTTTNFPIDQFDLLRNLSEIEDHAGKLDTAEYELMAQFCAKWIFRQVGQLDARWGRLIEAAKVETNRDDWKLIGSWIARILETGQHINSSAHPFFQTGGGRLVEQTCEECGVKFWPSVPGQRYHDNVCGTAAFNRRREADLARA